MRALGLSVRICPNSVFWFILHGARLPGAALTTALSHLASECSQQGPRPRLCSLCSVCIFMIDPSGLSAVSSFVGFTILPPLVLHLALAVLLFRGCLPGLGLQHSALASATGQFCSLPLLCPRAHCTRRAGAVSSKLTQGC